MKILLPVLIFLLVILTIVGIYFYKKSTSSVPSSAAGTSTQTISGDPDETTNSIIDAVLSENADTNGEDAELGEVAADIEQTNAIGNVYSENEI